MKKKIMLINGCSHTCGSEIDGNQDSLYNREHSFGNQLAKKLGYEAVNIASVGSTNPTIARNIIEWITENYNSDEMELYVLIAWSDSSRIEVCSDHDVNFHEWNASAPWHSSNDTKFYRINLGHEGGTPKEREVFPKYHRFIADNLVYLEIYSMNLILQLQYFLKYNNIDYTMCNTMNIVSDNSQIKFYVDQLDKSKYMDFDNPSDAFWWLYKNLGYVNANAKYWHHGIEPHTLYAEKLYNFITSPHESE